MSGSDLTAARDELLAEYPPMVAELTLRLRQGMLKVIPEASERVYVGWRGIGFHHPGRRLRLRHLPRRRPRHARVRAEDTPLHPDQRLEGTGNRVRYLTVTRWDPDLPVMLEALLHQAISLR